MGAARAIIRAHNDFRKMRKSFPVRTANATEADRDPRPNIIVQYFIRGRHTFSSLH